MEQVHTSTKLLPVPLDDKYGNKYLNEVMKTQCQHLTESQHNELLKFLQIFEELFDGTLGTCKTSPLDFELNMR